MIDLTMDEVAIGLHISLGVNFVMIPVALAWDHGLFWGNVACLIYALFKEFLFDILFEAPETSGGWLGGVKDFAGYIAGACIANALLHI